MKKTKNYLEFLNESKVETEIDIKPNNDYAYLLTVEDIEKIVNSFVDTTISRESILEELEEYETIKIEDVKMNMGKEVDDEIIDKLDDEGVFNGNSDTDIDNVSDKIKNFGEI